ncbi:U3 small nucleolar RNA-associated protein 11 [Ceratobasidium sp. AG-Ba]|nr:U3 small nucleolar RNA-associated protein 11 [Ceratobasidium sp. AG-Ba]QRW11784.1 U3 small nucleolar RNA-associated protein 11 [Ceratobasidium sp. AG-Ba]
MPLRNSLHRRQHKERSQLAHRSKIGLLEKHKDYVQRARDYRSKRDRLRTLRAKVETRNKDEFYFGMNKKKTRGGIALAERETEAMGEEMVKVLKSQDEGYLRTARSKGRKRIDAIRAEMTAMIDLVPITEDLDNLDEGVVETLRETGVLPLATTSRKGKGKGSQVNPRHIVFVNDEDAANRYAGSSKARLAESQDEWMSNEDGSDLDEDGDQGEDEFAAARAQKREAKRIANTQKNRLALLNELSARLKRDTALRHAIRELEMQRHLMAPGARTKIRGPERVENDDSDEEVDKKRGKIKFAKQGDVDYAPRVYKWRSERKR